MKIGILGGSFDPPHNGHVHITQQAFRFLSLDQVWWLPSKQNPLKIHRPASLPSRIEKCRQIIKHPRVRIIESGLYSRSNYTTDTLRIFRQCFPQHKFVWLMGADNLRDFHFWYKWNELIEENYVAVFSRPTYGYSALASITAQRYARYRLASSQSHALFAQKIEVEQLPRWIFLKHSMMDISSTNIRNLISK